MNIENFNYDANNASVTKDEKRVDSNGNVIRRIRLSNGVIFVFKQVENGFENLDTNYELIKQSNGYYKSDLLRPKKDFHDYY